MVAFCLSLIPALGRRVALAGALLLAAIVALYTLWRSGRAAGASAYAARRTEARIRTMTIAKETRHEVDTTSDADLDRRLDRWMRD